MIRTAATPGGRRPHKAPRPPGSGSPSGGGFPTKLSQHEQQILEEIGRGVQAEDPELFASMAGPRSRRWESVWGAVMLVIGLATFISAAIIAQVTPEVGFLLSLAAFMTIFWGLSLLIDWAFKNDQPAVLQRRLVRLWDSMKDPPPPGMSP